MDSPSSDFEDLLRCLNARGVRAVVVGGQPVFYLGREAFIKNKRASGRSQDLADIDALL